MEKKRAKKEQPFIVTGMTEKGGFSYRIEALNSALAHFKAIKKLQRDHPGELIRFIGQVHVEKGKREEEQQLVLPL